MSTARDVLAQAPRFWVAFEYSIFHAHAHASGGLLGFHTGEAWNRG